jgi:hypothetical protein
MLEQKLGLTMITGRGNDTYSMGMSLLKGVQVNAESAPNYSVLTVNEFLKEDVEGKIL